MGNSGIPIHIPGQVREAIVRSLRTHDPIETISTRATVQKVRLEFPDLHVRDADLANVIAQAAVDCGLAIELDGPSDED